jgi:hypothetical protein
MRRPSKKFAQSFNFHQFFSGAIGRQEVVMRRGFQAILMIAALAALTPGAFGQYPYPAAPPGYGPMPMPYAPPGYGPLPYAPPGYGPQPMYGQPMMPMPYYPPAPMWQPQRPTVFVYGPLTDPDAPPAKPPVKPAPVQPAPVKPAPPQPFPTVAKNGSAPANAPVAAANSDPTKKAGTGVTQVQATTLPAAPALKPAPCGMGDSCGVYGGGQCCPDAGCCPDSGCCDPIALPRAPLYGHGHWIGEVGAYFLVPYSSSRIAYTTTSGGATANTDFPQSVDFGPRVSLGYLFHDGWGVRANYWYLQGNDNTAISNSNLATTIATPMAPPFQSVSPGLALVNGLGVDQFAFQQRLNINVADVEVLKEFRWMDTTFLCSVGGRYALVQQSYAATRNNAGGFNGLETVAIDRDSLNAASNFEGWGPTASFEVMHLLGKSRFSVYANLRGSALWGVNRFSQEFGQQQSSVNAATGLPTLVNTDISAEAQSHREVTLLEAELGLQYGCRLGRCYVFGRAGAVYQHWFDVGTPTSANGDLTFIGGTARIGITY